MLEERREYEEMKDMTKDDPHRYDDIIGLSRPVSRKHPPMPIADRAVQFAPFAALTGHGQAILDTARKAAEELEREEKNEPFSD